MNRRTFSATSLTAGLAPLLRLSRAQQTIPDVTDYQVAGINDGHLTVRHEGMATPQVAVDDGTLSQLASCWKTVTALAILTLVRDDRAELDQPANRYLLRWQLPGPRRATATIAELILHTAGTTVRRFDGYAPDDVFPSLLEILAGRHPAISGAVRTSRRLFNTSDTAGLAQWFCKLWEKT